MSENYNPEINFSSLILTLASSAWVGMGKIADPISGEIKKDLTGVKYTIETLVMLREKTKGNLTEDEEKVLNNIISELQSNYAETVFSDGKEEAPSKEESKSSSSDEAELSKTDLKKEDSEKVDSNEEDLNKDKKEKS
jgi:hypothetical protein